MVGGRRGMVGKVKVHRLLLMCVCVWGGEWEGSGLSGM